MATDIIKEFLVKLGFKVDDESRKKFEKGVADATKEVANLGLKAAGAATAVGLAVTKIAEQYEDLYFASIRVNASAAHLATFAYGSRAIGISADQSAASLERLNVELKANPGKEALANMLGVQTAGRDTKQVYGDLIDVLAKMPRYLAYQFGGQFGMSPSEMNMRIKLRKDEVAAEKEYHHLLHIAGVNIDELDVKSHKYDQSLRQLESTIGVGWDQVANRWLPSMNSGVDILQGWAEWALKAGKETQGMTSTIAALVSALGGLKAFAWLLSFLPGRAGAAAASAAGIGGAALGAAVLGAGATVAALNYKETQEHPLNQRAPRNDAAIAGLPWYRRAAVWTQEHLFGADPNEFVGGGGSSSSKAKLPPQAALAIAMKHFGQRASVNRAELDSFFQSQGIHLDVGTTAWCAAYVNASLAAAGYKGSGSNMASSFAHWGQAVDPAHAQAGDVVYTSEYGRGSGHVGIATGQYDKQGRPQVVGGNTGGAVDYFYPSHPEVRRAGMDANLAPSQGGGQQGHTTNVTNHVNAHVTFQTSKDAQENADKVMASLKDATRYSGSLTTR